VPGKEIARGYELPTGRILILDDAELDDLPLPAAHTIEVSQVVPATTIDPIYFDRSYYLELVESGLCVP
jgi:DNA end-binding protein Ku